VAEAVGPVAIGPTRSEIGRAIGDLEISSAWLVDPASGREGPGDIVVEEGIVRSVVWLEGGAADGIDAGGVIVAPGFVDLHAHFREPGFEDAETIASGSAAAAHGGFTTVCLMPNTSPAIDEASVLARVRDAAARSGSPVEVLVYGAVTSGRARRWPPSASWPTAGRSGSATTARRCARRPSCGAPSSTRGCSGGWWWTIRRTRS
jgi:imidazolonepropionase-like amidohydrolase